ncbi:MAG: glycine cleavage system protein GcvH [Thermoplasmata archaeon]|nr:MAG: glycine cleavage system protein GcvH [Thermoplasmata archaeon]KAA0008316.1 MAG: glycine cleavage system protein GcvH [Thermoplasmata archaeon]
MEIRKDLLYSQSHEWIAKKDGIIRIGITDYAQDSLTDIVYVELPEVNKYYKKGDVIASVESVKSVGEIYAPCDGKVIAINDKLEDEPGLINESPYDEGWIAEMEVENEEDLEDLMDAEQYEELISKDL